MNFLQRDETLLIEAYDNFLYHLNNFFVDNGCVSLEDIFQLFSVLFDNGHFSITRPTKDTDYPYLAFPIRCSAGLQVMLGVCCCRHINGLFYDLLKSLHKNCELSFIFIDEDGCWYKKENGCGANHVVVTAQENNTDFLFDVYNNFGFTITKDDDLEPLSFDSSPAHLLSQYDDSSNINKISKVLTKYYQLRDIGITHVYEEDRYGY